jgi:hypothetical protein
MLAELAEEGFALFAEQSEHGRALLAQLREEHGTLFGGLREQDFAEFRELRHLLLPLLRHDGEQTLAQLGDVREQRFAVDREFLVRGDLEGDERVARLAQLLVDGRAELFGAFGALAVVFLEEALAQADATSA